MASILIVEDDDEIRGELADALRDAGYLVDAASNGLEATKVLRRLSRLPDLILLDLMMPLMDGWTFRREQLLDSDLGRIPVVILSAAGDVRRAAAALRASAFVVKPFRMAELLKTVQRVLDRGSAAAAH